MTNPNLLDTLSLQFFTVYIPPPPGEVKQNETAHIFQFPCCQGAGWCFKSYQ